MHTSVRRAGIGLAAFLTFAIHAAAVTPLLKELEDAFIRIGDEVRPCVVNIDVKTHLDSGEEGEQSPQNLEEFFRYFGVPNMPPNGLNMRQHPLIQASGSGFIFDKQGHIITNNHVVAEAEKVTVKLWNGEEYEAKVVASDEATDIAVIKIDTKTELPIARLGDSDGLKVGQFAVALGSPRGLEGTLSFGHVSALLRDNLPLQGLRFQNLIQTDAAINLGNSGGPLCNIDGEVIGINVAIVFGAESLGFAIPINTAKKVVPALISQGKVVRGYLGVRISSAEQYAEAEGLPDKEGAYVQEVTPGTAAEKAGLKIYDVIRKVNGQSVDNDADLVNRISDCPPGGKITLDVWRDGSEFKTEVTLGEFPANEDELRFGQMIFGMAVEALTPELAQGLGLDTNTKGVLVAQVGPSSPAEEAGLQQGDVILEVAKTPVESVDMFRALMTEHGQPGRSVLLRVARGKGTPSVIVLKIPAPETEQKEVPTPGATPAPNPGGAPAQPKP